MTDWLIASSIWAAWLRRPTTWVLLGGALVFSRWLERWLPLGLTTEDLQRLSAHYEIAFATGLLGASVAAAQMRQYATFTRHLAPLRRTVVESLVLLATAITGAAAILLPAHLLRTWQMGSFDAGAGLRGLAVGWLQFSLMLIVALRLVPADAGARGKARSQAAMASLLALVLAGPWLLEGHGALAASAAEMLDVGAALRESFVSRPFQASNGDGGIELGDAAGWARALFIAMYGLLSVALASPSTPRQTPPHALRDPR